MTRHLLTAAVLLLLSDVASAQIRPGRGGFGGGVRPVSPGVSPISPGVGPVSPVMPGISPMMGPISPGAVGVGGGFVRPGQRPGFPPIWGGGWLPFYGYPDYGYSGPTIVQVQFQAPTPVVQPPEPQVALSGQAVATLVLEFPTTAEVWVDGKKGEGEPTAEWTLTSPPLALGTEYVFKVKARWMANGKTFEYDRAVTVAAGNRSKALVVSGTEVKE